MDNALFETASRKKYRYPYKGWITTEDLWDLSSTQLDTVFKTLVANQKLNSETSLLASRKEDVDLDNMITIVKHVYTTKQFELERRKKAAENAEKRKHILEVLAQKQDETLRNMSEEELTKLLDGMEE